MEDKNEKTIIIRNVPEQLRKKLKLKAVQLDKSMNEIIINLIKNYLEPKPKPEKEG